MNLIEFNEKSKWEEHKKLFIHEEIKLGPTYSYLLIHNPRGLFFTLARYKFSSRLIGSEPKKRILEMGCNEGIGTLFFSENLHDITAVDFDKEAIEWAIKNLGTKKKNIKFIHDNFLGKHFGTFDAIVLIDVIEHIYKKNESLLFTSILDNLTDHGICIIGTPNVSASKYSSKTSEAGHVNLYSPERLRDLMRGFFSNVFLFGMNDEVVHTGYYPMCHYIFCLGCGKKAI